MIRLQATLRCVGGGALLLVAALGSGSCGARTELAPGEEACGQPGDVRVCGNACGTGEQRCEDGFWRECEVRRAERACSDVCGTGSQVCENGVWAACETPIVERSCSNDCGTGTQTCARGRWMDCEVAPTTRSCSDACGAGVETCSNGDWGSCEVPRVAVRCQSVCGEGEEICERGRFRPCNAPQPKPPTLTSRIRDFNDTHPDFEIPLSGNQVEPGIVADELGPDDKPVYRGGPLTTHGQQAFDQWYRDVPGVNMGEDIELPLAPSTDSPGLFVFEDTTFFPIDGRLLQNQGRTHNYHFTLEASTKFQYLGGEVFRFTGDDDMWVFINRRLAIDLGGIHGSLSRTVELDSVAARFGLVPGETYPLHFFFAERHTVQSNFTIETSISEPGSCD